jgi:hypothetical protein
MARATPSGPAHSCPVTARHTYQLTTHGRHGGVSRCSVSGRYLGDPPATVGSRPRSGHSALHMRRGRRRERRTSAGRLPDSAKRGCPPDRGSGAGFSERLVTCRLLELWLDNRSLPVQYTGCRQIFAKRSSLTKLSRMYGRALRHWHAMSGYAGSHPLRKTRPGTAA